MVVATNIGFGSRLSKKNVLASLTLSGVPVRRQTPTGYFINQDQLCGDFTGE